MSETVELDVEAILELGGKYRDGWRLETRFTSGSWRWGHESTFILQRESDGKFFAAVLRFQPEHGCTDEGEIELEEVVRREKVTVVWEVVKGGLEDTGE